MESAPDSSWRRAGHNVDGAEYRLSVMQLELYGKVDKESSKVQLAPRSILLVVAKQEDGFWPRLQRQKGKTPQNIKVDWSKASRLLHTPRVHLLLGHAQQPSGTRLWSSYPPASILIEGCMLCRSSMPMLLQLQQNC